MKNITYKIEGGNPLNGTVRLQSGKNACLPILAATILTDGKTIIRNVPRISDIENLLYIISGLGARIEWNAGDLHIDTTNIALNEINHEAAKKIRGSIFVLGGLVGRFKTARLPYPGGCAIGSRPIDLHVDAFRSIGIRVKESPQFIECRAGRIRGGTVYLDFPSVGATENIILASALGNATVTIVGAAKEPEVVDLVHFLRACGACIHGEGTDTITVQGVKNLKGTDYTPIPDRINTGSFLLAVATVGGDVVLENVIPQHNANLINKLQRGCCKIYTTADTIRIQKFRDNKRGKAEGAQTAPYPGFSTDLQCQFAVWQSLQKGTSKITENLFENRFRYASELVKLGANMCIDGRSITIKGVPALQTPPRKTITVEARELRGGVALVIAALATKGEVIINNAQIIERGHEHLDRDLAKLGATILKIEN